jgi:hypothetical protein
MLDEPARSAFWSMVLMPLARSSSTFPLSTRIGTSLIFISGISFPAAVASCGLRQARALAYSLMFCLRISYTHFHTASVGRARAIRRAG